MTSGRRHSRERRADFRATATRGVALAALTLLLPFVFVSVFDGAGFAAVGTAAIVLMLALNVWLVATDRDHERLTLGGLVPAGMLFMTHIFERDAIIGSVWCYPAVLACYCMLGRRRAMLANAIILAVALPMIWLHLEPSLAARFTATLLAVSVFAVILVREIDAMRHRLRHQAEHDPLTGLRNRSTLERLLGDAAARRGDRHGRTAALLAIDIDHFKRVNDSLGHEAGDLVLREIARVLRASARVGDDVFRLGGEEFLILIHDIDPDSARRRAEELRERIARARILQHGTVTASIGLACLRENDDVDAWMRRADERIYAAKRAGRDRVVWREEGTEPAATDGGVGTDAARDRRAVPSDRVVG